MLYALHFIPLSVLFVKLHYTPSSNSTVGETVQGQKQKFNEVCGEIQKSSSDGLKKKKKINQLP